MSATDHDATPRCTDRTIDLTKQVYLGRTDIAWDPGSLSEKLVGSGISGARLVRPDAGGRLPGDALLVREALGRGALGEVYEVCPHRERRKRFALKVPRLPLERTAAAVKNEIDKLSRVRGTHLPRLLLHGELELDELRVPYYVTHLLQPIAAAYPEYAGGRQLHPLRTLETVYALARTLAELAEAGVVHNDFKLENVMFHETLPLLVDFGTAKFSSEINEIEAARQAGKLHGTPSWLPPEVIQLRPGPDGEERVYLDLDGISQFTDVYGLGLLLMVILTGHELFDGVPLGHDVLSMFRDIHHQFHERDLLGGYRRTCKRTLERLYLATDAMTLDRLHDDELAGLYDLSPSGSLPAEQQGDTLWRRLTRKLTKPRPAPRKPAGGLALREKLVRDLLELFDDCTAPIDPAARRRRLRAQAVVARMESAWPGLPLWYQGRGYLALPALDLE